MTISEAAEILGACPIDPAYRKKYWCDCIMHACDSATYTLDGTLYCSECIREIGTALEQKA